MKINSEHQSSASDAPTGMAFLAALRAERNLLSAFALLTLLVGLLMPVVALGMGPGGAGFAFSICRAMPGGAGDPADEGTPDERARGAGSLAEACVCHGICFSGCGSAAVSAGAMPGKVHGHGATATLLPMPDVVTQPLPTFRFSARGPPRLA